MVAFFTHSLRKSNIHLIALVVLVACLGQLPALAQIDTGAVSPITPVNAADMVELGTFDSQPKPLDSRYAMIGIHLSEATKTLVSEFYDPTLDPQPDLISVMDIESGETRFSRSFPANSLERVVLSPRGQFLAFWAGSDIQILDTVTGAEVMLITDASPYGSWTFSRTDDLFLYTAEPDLNVVVLDLNLRQVASQVDDTGIHHAIFCPDVSCIVYRKLADSGQVFVWDLESAYLAQAFRYREDNIGISTGLVISRSGRAIVIPEVLFDNYSQSLIVGVFDSETVIRQSFNLRSISIFSRDYGDVVLSTDKLPDEAGVWFYDFSNDQYLGEISEDMTYTDINPSETVALMGTVLDERRLMSIVDVMTGQIVRVISDEMLDYDALAYNYSALRQTLLTDYILAVGYPDGRVTLFGVPSD
jgi:WD40 repeat protein